MELAGAIDYTKSFSHFPLFFPQDSVLKRKGTIYLVELVRKEDKYGKKS
jgi:hypothetical protein